MRLRTPGFVRAKYIMYRENCVTVQCLPVTQFSEYRYQKCSEIMEGSYKYDKWYTKKQHVG